MEIDLAWPIKLLMKYNIFIDFVKTKENYKFHTDDYETYTDDTDDFL